MNKSCFRLAYANGIGMMMQLNEEFYEQHDLLMKNTTKKRKKYEELTEVKAKNIHYLHFVIAQDMVQDDGPSYQDLLKL